MLTEGTIVALATPQGSGAIGVIRVSGPQAFEKTALFFLSKSKKSWSQLKANRTHLGNFVADKVFIDELLITKFEGPHSYTGEDVVELYCHGSNYILQKIIASYLEVDVLPAQPGEFTLRAYLNKKMDLSQAEAVADLIASESQSAHQLALQQMRGGFSQKMEVLRQELIQFKALIELELDFGEEDVEFANLTQLQTLLNKLHRDITELKDSFAYGNAIKNGVPVAIAGKPNVGKSSLLNALLNEEKAIVSTIPGTTRDSIEDTLVIEGILFRFIDTAGLRETQDVVEAIGIKKAREKVGQAAILVYLYEKEADPEATAEEINELQHEGLSILLIENKIDLTNNQMATELSKKIVNSLKPLQIENALGISTQNKINLNELQKKLVAVVQQMKNDSSLVIHNSRHFFALKKALKAIEDLQSGLSNNISGDLLSIELKEAIYHIGSITGAIDHDHDVLGTIFSQFCIGK